MPNSFTNNVRHTISSISRRCGVPAYRQANSMSETVSNGSHRKGGKILMHTMKQGHGVGADLVLGSDAGNLPEVVPRLVMKVTMCGENKRDESDALVNARAPVCRVFLVHARIESSVRVFRDPIPIKRVSV